MDCLIWGTGKCAQEIMEIHGMGYFREHAILAFIDNNKEKVGKKYYGREVIFPSQIINYSFEKILICSDIYEKDITEQLVNGIGIEKKFIMTLNDLENDYYSELVKKNYLYSKFLIIGDERLYKQREKSYTLLFKICGFLDIHSIGEIENYQYDYILLMDLMNISCLNRTLGKMKLEKEMIKFISKKYDIDEDIILTDAVFRSISSIEKKYSFGEENEDKTFLIIQQTSRVQGLGGGVLRVAHFVAYAQQKRYYPIVDMSIKSQYLEKNEEGRINAWEKFFMQPTGYSLQDIKKSKNVIIVGSGPINRKQSSLMNNISLDFLKMQPWVESQVIKYIKIFLGKTDKVLGVLFRGTDYTNTRPYGHQKQPELKMMISKVKEKLLEWGDFDRIYLCTEVEQAVECFKNEFGEKVCFYPQKRVQEDFNGRLSEIRFKRKNDAYHKGADYWIVLNILSKCHSLIAGKCAGTTIALMLNNGEYKNKYLFELGRYGIDD